jgi:excisionase family DNA binding protein
MNKKVRGRLLNVREFAASFGCTVSCARRWISERRIVSVKVGRRLVRIPETEIERLIGEGLRPIRRQR